MKASGIGTTLSLDYIIHDLIRFGLNISYANIKDRICFCCCSIVNLKDVHSGRTEVLYDAKQAIGKLNTPIVKDAKVLSVA